MNIAFVVNSILDLKPTMSTLALGHAALAAGHDVCFVSVEDLTRGNRGTTPAAGRLVRYRPEEELTAFVARLQKSAPVPVTLERMDAVWTRTNPARDPRKGVHRFAEWCLRDVHKKGVPVLNTPAALALARDKTYLSRLPATVRPEMCISPTMGPLLDFLGGHSIAVFKPVSGTRGRGVFVVQRGGPNAKAILELLLEEGPVVAQEYVEGADKGDTRVIVCDGEPLVVDGRWAAVRRVPSGGDHRSNVHAGATTSPAELSPAQQRAVTTIAKQLARDGVWCAGIDLVGTVALEINVSAPGGLSDSSRFEARDFAAAWVEAFVRRVSAPG